MERITNKNRVVRQPEFKEAFGFPENKRTAKFGLPVNVQFCKKCIISNQRPNSAIEFKHTSVTKKETIGFDEERGDKVNVINASFTPVEAVAELPEPELFDQPWVSPDAKCF